MPGGMLYFQIKRPLLQLQKAGRSRSYATDPGVESDLLRMMDMNGFVIGDEDTYRQTCERDIQSASMVVRGVSVKKDGTFSKRVLAPSADEFALIMATVKGHIKALCERLRAGDFSVSPYKKKNRSACDYCQYRSACRIELAAPGAAYRRIEQISDGAALSAMRRGAGGYGGAEP
ncbi:MAG: PD-(D/E)XK nuclease family protein [Clostridiales bacterium]|nr:PD-(D/E)XK nuclease family protein [Clostridiales bacterium]